MNDTILPITDAIIGYLQKERLNNDKNNFLNDLTKKTYKHKEEDDITIIIKQEYAFNRLKQLKIEARINNYDNIWIYEQIVLEGYGYYIDYYSDIYQEMLEKYNEMYKTNKYILKKQINL